MYRVSFESGAGGQTMNSLEEQGSGLIQRKIYTVKNPDLSWCYEINTFNLHRYLKSNKK